MLGLLNDILPIDKLREHQREGFVRSQVHPIYPELTIYNYTQSAQFDRVWDEVTNVCRGLITATSEFGEFVIARGFNKFHNLNTEYLPDTMEENLPEGIPQVTKKLDGSLGILYFWDEQWWVATRGSFDSQQARWATDWLRNHYQSTAIAPKWRAHYSPVCEIIYTANRIVVDYDFEGLVVLGMIHNWTGTELTRELLEQHVTENQLPLVEKFDKTLAECAADEFPNQEGYVLTYPNGLKVKVKFTEYVRLHRIVTGLNPKAIWELLTESQGSAVVSILKDERMPDSFKRWFGGWVGQLSEQYSELEGRAQAVFNQLPIAVSDDPKLRRKANALYFQGTPDLASILFAMLDGKDYAPIIWDRLKPKGTDTFKKDGE